MDHIKRVNLYFDLRNSEHRKIYELIMKNKAHKTGFIINQLLVVEKNIINKQEIKNALKEVLQEFDFKQIPEIEDKKEFDTGEIPNEIFDLLDKL